MKNFKPVTAAASALVLTLLSTSPIYADATAVDDTTADSAVTTGTFDGCAVADVEIGEYCNVRADATEDSERVGVLYPGCVAEVVGEKDGWTEIKSGNVQGYVRSDLLVTGSDINSRVGKNDYVSYTEVTAPLLNVRSGAGMDNDIIGTLANGEHVKVLSYEDGWYKAELSDGTEGYISAEWVTAGDDVHCAMSNDEFNAYLTALENGETDADFDSIIDSEENASDDSSEDTSTDETDTTADSAEETASDTTGETTTDTTTTAEDTTASDTTDTESTADESTDDTSEDVGTVSTTTEETTTDTTEDTSTVQTASGSDVDLLAALIYCEAGNQSYEGKVAVGAVVMNRVESSAFPNSISEVIYQSGQFTPASSGSLASALASGVPSSCYQAAQDAIAGTDPTNGALYFYAGSGNGTVIDGQTFY